jgi:hypothetical protein
LTGSNDVDEDADATSTLSSARFRVGRRLEGDLERWPIDVDGDALLRLAEDGFDFSKPCLIEFTVDFRSWPPHRDAMKRLSREYPSAAVCATDEDHDGYLEFQVYALVTYELVTNIQSYVTEVMAPYHGVCSSWGVLRITRTVY